MAELNFGLAQYQPINALAAYKQGVDVVNAQREQDQQNQLKQFQLAQMMQTAQRQQNVRNVLAQTGGDVTQAIPALLKAGYTQEAAQLHSIMPKPDVAAISPLQKLFQDRAKYQPGTEEWNAFTKQIQLQAQGEKPQNPYYSPVQTETGIQAFDARTGTLKPLNVKGAQFSPELQSQLASAKESAKKMTDAQVGAIQQLPTQTYNVEQQVKLIDNLVSHPGKKYAVGAGSIAQTWRVPGSPGADFVARLNQIKGKQFLEAYNTLRGGGQITEVEGKKATDALSRMQQAVSIQEFDEAAKEYKDVIQTGLDRLKRQAKGDWSPQAKQPANVFDAADAIIGR